MNFEWNPTRKEMLLSALGFPVQLENKLSSRAPFINRLLLVAMILTFFMTLLRLIDPMRIAFSPVHAFDLKGATFISSFFVHANIIHLLGNGYFLRIFGNLAERTLKSAKFLFLVLLSTVMGNCFVYFFEPRLSIPHGGASGGISGIMIYCLLAFPRQSYGVFFFGSWIKIPASWLMMAFVAFQIYGMTTEIQGIGQVSYLSHIGGVIAGFLFWFLLRKHVTNTNKQIEN